MLTRPAACQVVPQVSCLRSRSTTSSTPRFGQVIGDRATHDTTANNDDLGLVWEIFLICHTCLFPSRVWVQSTWSIIANHRNSASIDDCDLNLPAPIASDEVNTWIFTRCWFGFYYTGSGFTQSMNNKSGYLFRRHTD